LELPLIFPSSWHEFSALSETWDDEFEKGPKQLKKDEMKAINKWGVTWKWSEDFVCASVQSWNDLTWSYLYFIVSPYHFFVCATISYDVIVKRLGRYDIVFFCTEDTIIVFCKEGRHDIVIYF